MNRTFTDNVQITCKGCNSHARISTAEAGKYMREHIASCDQFSTVAKSVWADMLKGRDEYYSAVMMCAERAFRLAVVNHRPRRDGSLANCGGRCINAKGGDCDCQCMGANHGIGG